MTLCTPENWLVDWSSVTNTMPPREPNDDDAEDEDDEDENQPDEPAVVREPDDDE